MSGLAGQQAPNVPPPAPYTADMNAFPSPQDVVSIAQDSSTTTTTAALEDDIALFTDTQFFDFDMGEQAEMPQTFGYSPVEGQNAHGDGLPPLNYLNQGYLHGYTGYQAFTTDTHAANLPPSHHPPYPPLNISSPTSPTAPGPATGPSSGRRRPRTSATISSPSTTADPQEAEDASRVTAEEDKRRRNTAASARFRVKKKQREQAVEKTAKEMTEKVSVLEAKISQLEMENKWLKSLITEKNNGGGGGAGGKDGAAADLFKRIGKIDPALTGTTDAQVDGAGAGEKAVADKA